MKDAQISYEEYIPTDKWSLQDWYLMKMVVIERTYNRLIRGLYAGGIDKRALIDFFSEVRSYHAQARHNIEKHLSEVDYSSFVSLLAVRPDLISVDDAESLMSLLSSFHWKSGLTKLSESRPLGDFAYARKKLGLDPRDKEVGG